MLCDSPVPRHLRSFIEGILGHRMSMESFSVALVLLQIGGLIRSCQSSTCHAQCDYDHVTGRVDCSFRHLDCIPVNYPDALVMDLSHNDITVLEPADFNGTFTRLVELYLDHNNITDVTSFMTSSEMGRLEKLSIKHNAISGMHSTCTLSSLVNMSVDYNFLVDNIYIPRCPMLQYFSANFNLIMGIYLLPDLPSVISLQFNQIQSFTLKIQTDIQTLYLDQNQIHHFEVQNDSVNVVSLSHNELNTLSLSIPLELNMASNGLTDFRHSFNLSRSRGRFMNKLDIRNNSFHSLRQPDWAEGLQILYADDNMLTNLSSTTLQGFSSLTELHLANNRLSFISSSALRQLILLQSLYLDDNDLASLQDGTFLSQAELKELSIKNNQLSVLRPNYFTGLDSLERLSVAGNRLLYVHADMFGRLTPELITIDLSQNEIIVFDITNCNRLGNLQSVLLAQNSVNDITYILGHCDNLLMLDLRFNQIEVVPGDSLSDRNRALSRLELQGNPLQCDCRLTGLRDWLLDHPSSVLPRCQSPPRYSGAVVTDLKTHDFSCDPPKAMSNGNHLTVTVGQTATLSCTATGIPAPNITWLDPAGTVISDGGQGKFLISKDMTLFVISVKISDQGLYTCLVQNALGEIDKSLINITVTEVFKSTDLPTVTNKPTSISLAPVVLPTVFITIVVTLSAGLVALAIRRCCRHVNRQIRNPSFSGQAQPTVNFRRQRATHSEGGYVSKVDGEEYMTPMSRPSKGGEIKETPGFVYENTGVQISLQSYQRQPTNDTSDDVYEPVSVN
ncbi:leucine-rich repeat-containing protein 15-like [Acanthaster planci]|uniref:Leucine-rich repeat-containing protein 15-like n=1 Tax=Acanthaster planci TaxID=133434 RepID=A0A8B7YBE1_ACAPL|nr:leucine-rich repeat-containing protein 15-like [Acanthaster planci]